MMNAIATTALFAAFDWKTFGAVLGFALIAFTIFGGALAIPALRGRSTNRKCACATSRQVMKILEERERVALEAARYKPEEVDVTDLPTASAELANYARSTSKK